jgi:4'-phosphopantetheinyl transferase
LSLTSANVDIWTIALDAFAENLLSAEEAVRAARFHFERDRVHWTAARSALRRVLSDRLRVKPAEIEFTLGPHGKPAVTGVQFNISHSHGWAMIALSESVPVGVDLEAIRDRVDMAKLLERLHETDLPAERTALFQRWTEREARTKAIGSPLMERPPDHIRAVPLNAPEGFAASVALVGAVPLPRHCGAGSL